MWGVTSGARSVKRRSGGRAERHGSGVRIEAREGAVVVVIEVVDMLEVVTPWARRVCHSRRFLSWGLFVRAQIFGQHSWQSRPP